MPLTPAEKQSRYRERLKSTGQYADVREKDKLLKRANRSDLTPTEKNSLREKNRNYKRVERLRKRTVSGNNDINPVEPEQSSASDDIDSSVDTPCTPAAKQQPLSVQVFSSRQTLGKARKRVTTALGSYSPRKQRVLLKELSKKAGLEVKETEGRRENKAGSLLPETKLNVEHYYNDNEVSWQTPGLKDCVTVRSEAGVKSKVQKRFMLMTLKEAHSLFCEQHSDTKIGLASFSSLRPQHIFLQKDIPHNVCVCKVHENVRLLLESLKQKGVPVKSGFSEFIAQIVCNQEDEGCMLGKCQQCPTIAFLNPDDDVANERCVWQRWKSTVAEKEEVEGTVKDCFTELSSIVPSFLDHTFVKRKQQGFFRKCTQDMSDGEITVQIDFAENYAVKEQDEIQSAHWSNNQITVFTGVVWFLNDGTVERRSFALVTDYLGHDKYAVHVFLNVILENIRAETSFHTVHFFSDGAASQFKQKYNFVNLTYLQEQGVTVHWHFFATSHGKGAVDGVGGEVKRMAWLDVLSGKKRIQCASEFVECVQAKNTRIKIIHVMEADIENIKELLDERWAGIKAIPGTQKLHSIQVVERDKVRYAKYSQSVPDAWECHVFKEACDTVPPAGPLPEQPPAVVLPEMDKFNIQIEHYYPVFYDLKFYIGRVITITGDMVRMKFLKETYPGTFNWSPGKQYEEDVDSKYIFYGAIQLQGHGPFSVPDLGMITKQYRKLKSGIK